MAFFVSAQSGNWHDPLTWDVGTVPNLGSDDVIIAYEHEVVFESGYYESLAPGRLLAVGTNSTLRIQGGIDAYDSDVIVVGEIIAEGNHLAVWGEGRLEIDPTGTLTVASSLYLESGATATIEGQLIIESGGYADIYFDGVLTLESGGVLQDHGYCYCEYGGAIVARDNFSVETGGYLDVFDYASMTVEDNGAVFIYGALATGYSALIDVFGYLAVAADGYLRVYPGGQINVYKNISISGRMTGGGRIVMLRREGRILDFNDNPIFVLDRAYGFGQTQIA